MIDYFPWKIQPNGIFDEGELRFFTTSKTKMTTHWSQGKALLLKIRDHEKCIKIWEMGLYRIIIYRNNNSTFHHCKD